MKKTILIILFLFILLPLFSQAPIKFEHISLQDGLSQSSVKCILQDSKGFMWFGTFDGLNKYDGYEIQIFRNTKDSNSIAGNSINAIFEDKQQNIWFGISQRGLSKYNPKNENFELYSNNEQDSTTISNNTILSICEDKKNNLWIATKNGLNKFDKNTKKSVRFFTKEGLYNNFIYKVVKDSKENIWLGTRSGLNCYDIEKDKIVKITSGNNILYDKKIRDLYIDKNQILWIATNKGFFSVNIKSISSDKNTQITSYQSIATDLYSIAEDNKGNIWLATKNSGIEIFNKYTKTFYTLKNSPVLLNSLTVNNILSVYKDRSNIMWVGTELGGVNKYNVLAKSFESHSYNPLDPNSISSNQIRTIYEDSQNIIWLGTKNGLNKWLRNESKFIHYQYDSKNKYSIKDNYVRAILEIEDGNFWIGTDTAGILVFNPKTEQFFKQYKNKKNVANSLSNNKIWKVLEDSKGQIWVATFGGGLNKYNPETDDFKSYTNDPENKTSISGNKITTVYEDQKGNLWIGTFENGINLYMPESDSFIQFHKKNTDTDLIDRIYYITEDSHGKLWVAAEGSLNLFDDEINLFTAFNYNSLNFSNPVLMSILEDEDQNFWISTNNGLIKYNVENGGVKTFYLSDGLLSNEFMIGANLISSKGEMFFGGINGLNVFYPKKIYDNPNKPSIIITNFKILNELPELDTNITYKKTLELEYTDNEFSFEFVAIDYGLSEKNQYAYMLKGYDENWIYCKNRRFASYTNLNPGKYVFMVKGSNNDGVWNNNGTEVAIIIKPPFWQKTWFIILILFLLAFGIYALLKYRDVSRDKKYLETKVAQRTVQITQQNEEISSQLEEIETQKENLQKSYKNIRILSEIGQKITANLSIESIFETAQKNIGTLIDSTIFGVGIYNKQLKRLDFNVSTKNKSEIDILKIKLNEKNKLATWCFDNKDTVIINNYEKEIVNYTNDKKIEPLLENNLKSIIYQPIISGDRCIGVITVQSMDEKKYKNYHINIIKNLAVYISIALGNTQSYSQLQLQKRHITDSISYARRIQEAILPPKKVLDSLLKNYFLYFKPRDIVSGDFYWAKKVVINKQELTIILAADCTGHGVPGAFMSMLGVSLLNEIVAFYENKLDNPNNLQPHLILNELRSGIINSLRQTGKFHEPQDGMDIALSIIDFENMTLKFSGANNSLLHIRKSSDDNFEEPYKLTEVKPNRMPIGYFLGNEKSFTSETINLEKNDTIYMFSDGYTDQLGGKNERKFLKKRFKKLLLSFQEKSMDEQEETLEEVFQRWISFKNFIGDYYEQLDDIVIIGIKI